MARRSSTRAATPARRTTVRGLAAVALLTCALAPGVSWGDRLAVWAVGLPSGNFTMAYQAAVIRITEEDIARGTVEVSGGSRLVVATDSPEEYALRFSLRSDLFRGVRIDGIGSTVELTALGGTVVRRDPATGRREIALSYRFILASDAAPGLYPWPLELSVGGSPARGLQGLIIERQAETSQRRR